MDNTNTKQIFPLLDTNALNAQLSNYKPTIKVDIDSSAVQQQLQAALSKASKIPIKINVSAPTTKEKDGFISFLSDASSYATKSVMPSVG